MMRLALSTAWKQKILHLEEHEVKNRLCALIYRKKPQNLNHPLPLEIAEGTEKNIKTSDRLCDLCAL